MARENANQRANEELKNWYRKALGDKDDKHKDELTLIEN
jgi:hypothetical protein